jgi:hypothetical protein
MSEPGRHHNVHLFRGAPMVRSWSKYKATVPEWTLCGIRRKIDGRGNLAEATENPAVVSCPFCLDLAELVTERRRGGMQMAIQGAGREAGNGPESISGCGEDVGNRAAAGGRS